ncbi:DUF4847 family protein [uncultured Bacteroides sp.]|uniref:DUF4847 family protein n=1 Tax=uncultured Bacteroides sp. TaxID=162156 RepID=UPI002AA88C7D|nr:DUF4847 family protein [uncultured Bacteroides sp.]
MKYNYKHLLFLIFMLPVFSGCNDTDDVVRIFTGKTWKLTGIYLTSNDKECEDYWTNSSGEYNENAYKASQELRAAAGNCVVTFSGVLTGNTISGNFSGKCISTSLNGTWRADGESRSFNASTTNPGSESDVLGKAYIDAWGTAQSYSGDQNNLYIYFKDGQTKKYLLFHVQK